jgi:hypothetical protein
MQHVDAVLVRDVGQARTVVGERVVVDVPLRAGHDRALAVREIHPHQVLELRAVVGSEVDRRVISGELRARMRDLNPLFFRRREERLCAGRDVDAIDLALVRREEVRDQHGLAVARDVGAEPAAAFDLEDHLRAGRRERVDHPDVGVVAVPLRRGVDQPLPVARPGPAGVARLAVREQRHLARPEVQPVELEELPSPDVLREHDHVRGVLMERRIPDRVVEERDLPPRPARHLHDVQLRGVGEARPDQDLLPGRMPPAERGRAEVEVRLDPLDDRGRKLRHVLDDQIRRHLGESDSGENEEGEERKRAFHGAGDGNL